MKYSCQTTITGLLSTVKSTLILDPLPSDDLLYGWLNVFLCGLYTGVIREKRLSTLQKTGDDRYPLPTGGSGDAAVFRPSDIMEVYADGELYERVSSSYALRSPYEGERVYYVNESNELVLLSTDTLPDSITVCYRARPTAFGSQNASGTLPLPEEFVPMAEAKLLGDAYRWAGENTLAANWLTEYNAQLDSFRLWIRSEDQR